jgi:hypothetical protein
MEVTLPVESTMAIVGLDELQDTNADRFCVELSENFPSAVKFTVPGAGEKISRGEMAMELSVMGEQKEGGTLSAAIIASQMDANDICPAGPCCPGSPLSPLGPCSVAEYCILPSGKTRPLPSPIILRSPGIITLSGFCADEVAAKLRKKQMIEKMVLLTGLSSMY